MGDGGRRARQVRGSVLRRPDVPSFLTRLRLALDERAVVVSIAAAEQATEELGWDEMDIYAELHALEPADFLRTEISTVRIADLVWVFCPPLEGGRDLWIRLVERDQVVVVSFHLREWL